MTQGPEKRRATEEKVSGGDQDQAILVLAVAKGWVVKTERD